MIQRFFIWSKSFYIWLWTQIQISTLYIEYLSIPYTPKWPGCDSIGFKLTGAMTGVNFWAHSGVKSIWAMFKVKIRPTNQSYCFAPLMQMIQDLSCASSSHSLSLTPFPSPITIRILPRPSASVVSQCVRWRADPLIEFDRSSPIPLSLPLHFLGPISQERNSFGL